MKKTYFFFIMSVLAIIVTGCSKVSSNIQYIPCKTDKKADWGFMDKQGNVVVDDMFKDQPSYVRDGVFSVQEADDLYTLYAFDTKKPTIILENLVFVGSPRNGLLPVCKKDHRIEVIDTKGHTKFELYKIGDKIVKSCSPQFQFGYLVVESEEGLYGMVNTDGQLLLDLKYSALKPIKKDFILALKSDLDVDATSDDDEVAVAPLNEDYMMIDDEVAEAPSNEDYIMINEKGNKYDGWKKEDLENINSYYLLNVSSGSDIPVEYLVVDKGDRLYIYNLKGEQVLKCPDRVKDIYQIKNGFFVYKGEDDCGVMNLKGERIVNEKYVDIDILDNGFLAQRDYGKNFELLNENGESIRKIDDYDSFDYAEGFGYWGIDGNEEFILDNEFQPIQKNGLYEVGDDDHSASIQSDFLDIDAIVETLVSAKSGKLSDWGLDFGKTIGKCDYLKSQNIKYYQNDYYYMPDYASSRLYKMSLEVVFDRQVRKEIYKDVQVERYSYYYGYYYDTERQFSHYEKNDEAAIRIMGFVVEVPKDRRKDVFNALCDALESKNTKIERTDESAKYIGTYEYKVFFSNRDQIVFAINPKNNE